MNSREWCVYIDAGEFDFEVYRCVTKYGAKKYKHHLAPLCRYKLKVKPANQMREIDSRFIEEGICTGISVLAPQ